MFSKKYIFYTLLFLSAFFRLVVCSYLYGTDKDDKLDFNSGKLKFSHGFYYGGDEHECAKSALYYRNTGKILIDSTMHSFTKPRLRSNLPYLTAFRPKGFIYSHVFLISLYEKLYDTKVEINNNQSINSYLNFYGMILYIISILLYVFSIFYFYKLLNLIKLNIATVQIGTILYVFIPSIFIYIGMIDSFENIALYCQVIFVYFIIKEWFAGQNFRTSIFAPFLVLSCLFRPHLLLTYVVLIISLIFTYIYINRIKKSTQKYFYNIKTASLSLGLLTFVIVAIFIQNYSYFGKCFLSTQANFEFFQGHNPFARSSWNPNIYTQNSHFFDSIILEKQIGKLNELQESQFYSEISWDWIRDNPFQVLKLECKKAVAYFIPYNHNNRTINLYTLFLEIGFILFFIYWLLSFLNKKFSICDSFVGYLILIPVIMTICLTILFFVGYRWRFYAEPFMLIMALILVEDFIIKFNRSRAN